MTRIVAATFVSLDGLFSGPAGEQDWTFPYLSAAVRSWITAENENHSGVIMGATSYRLHCDYWPNVSIDSDASARFMNLTPKYIVSHSLTSAPWGRFDNAKIVNGDIVARLQEVAPDGNLVIVGSGSIVRQLTAAGAVDEWNLISLPVILGSGAPLFDASVGTRSLRLSEVRAFDDGAVMHRYLNR